MAKKKTIIKDVPLTEQRQIKGEFGNGAHITLPSEEEIAYVQSIPIIKEVVSTSETFISHDHGATWIEIENPNRPKLSKDNFVSLIKDAILSKIPKSVDVDKLYDLYKKSDVNDIERNVINWSIKNIL